MKTSALFIILFTMYIGVQMAANSKQNFCHNNQCLTCVGRYCTTTCQGEGCSRCPLGDCCDGSQCNICRGEKCCSTPECNTCIITCLKECQGRSTCHYDCFQKCLPGGTTGNSTGNQNFGSPIISNRNYLPVNVTTRINITNTIENQNVLHHPILINTTNIRNYTGHRTGFHRKQIMIADGHLNGSFITNNKKQNCCEIVHPEICRKMPEEQGLICYTRKHKECSHLCTSKYVHIVKDKEAKDKCININEQPHWFCGKYAIENCDNCHNCTNIDDLECTQDTSCSDKCRLSLIPEEFYNKLYRKD